jgi:hypothetical protein
MGRSAMPPSGLGGLLALDCVQNRNELRVLVQRAIQL